jgi:hypothetical protein
MVTPNAAPCLFMSHSGADTDAARQLKRRLLESPDARAARLAVWLDKDDLGAGIGWQAQIEKAISEKTTAFAVHLVQQRCGELGRLGGSARVAACDRRCGLSLHPDTLPGLRRRCIETPFRL